MLNVLLSFMLSNLKIHLFISMCYNCWKRVEVGLLTPGYLLAQVIDTLFLMSCSVCMYKLSLYKIRLYFKTGKHLCVRS